MKKWLVIGVSGVTCGGKTTVARSLHESLSGSYLLCQDDYFLPPDSRKHTWIPTLNHINWEIMSSVDMNKMWADIKRITQFNFLQHFSHCKIHEEKSSNDLPLMNFEALAGELPFHILIIEGFLVLNYQPIVEICHLKYYLTLTRDQCWERRKVRIYDPPDVPGYFDVCVWPEYEKHRDEVFQTVADVHIIDGTNDVRQVVSNIFLDIMKYKKITI
ncbi:nicotinamide riboside kinase 1 [Schistocerca americana]|uniref:nicotinamide riboside kinase 1 n=1 Tax=Schistocerca americana TaxID=7009 RepID=UPI001F4F3743|nr:nicotinamide riboside kinase 1 [Schistocerca americana]